MNSTPNANPPSMPPTLPSKKGVGWVARTLFLMAIGGTVLITFVGGAIFWHFSLSLPKIVTVEDYRPATVTRILGGGGRDDMLMGEFSGRERRYVVPFEKIPDVLVKAFISAEDDSFFEHQGVNLVSIIRAAIANARAGHVVQGGSTITQQVAKSLLLTSEKSFTRKIKELILANRFEKNLTKQQILYLYLNQIYLGSGAYGVQAASRTYFRKDVSQLTLAEAAILAGMPQAPSNYAPNRNPKKAKDRQIYVLRRMFENKFITREQLTQASAQAIRVYREEDSKGGAAPYLVEHVRRYLIEKYGEKAVYEDGLTVAIPTTPQLAKTAKKSVQEGLRTVDKRLGYRGAKKRLKDMDAIEEFLKEERLSLIEKKLGYQMFLPDGRLDPIESIHEAGFKSESQLLDVGEIYSAVVMRPDEKEKKTHVVIGALKAELPLDQMSWARAYRDEKNPNPAWTVISPSRVFQKGDVIQVRVLVNDPIKGITVALEQEPAVQGALFSIEAQTGYVLAMEGGFDFANSEFNRATQAQRQPGSAFKPIIFSAGLEKGFTPASIIVDSPIVYDDAESGSWKPKNYEGKFYGDTTFRQALIKSRNIPTIKIVQSINVPFLIDYAKRIGLEGKFNRDFSIALGSGSVTLYEMTRAYALFPRLGRKVDPILILNVRDRDGRVIEERKPSIVNFIDKTVGILATPTPSPSVISAPSPGEHPVAMLSPPPVRPAVVFPQLPTAEDPDQVMDPRVAYVMTHLMKEVVAYGTGQEAKQLQRPAAGKTGTTDENVDAWFMGFTPFVVSGAWVGFDSQHAIGPAETGARAALPIWLSFMREAVKPYPDADFHMPNGVVYATIDPASGKLASNSSIAIKEAFVEGTEPIDIAASGPTTYDSAGDFLKEDSE